MQYDTVEKAVKSALKKFGKIDILVNCKSFLSTLCTSLRALCILPDH